MKMLYIKHRSGKRMNNFALSAILAAKELGIDFTIANNMSMAEPGHFEQVCEQYGIKMVHIDFDRNPLSLHNIKAGKQLLALMEREKYDIVHCNTPSGGLVGRICAAKAKVPKVIYMAHGFHFWKGAPLKNWLCYYPVERFLAHFTDRLITINQEDYSLAQKFHYKKGGRAVYVPGVGIVTTKFTRNESIRTEERRALGIKAHETVLLSVGEVNCNKNHGAVIKALAMLGRKDIRYIICGVGDLMEKHRALAASYGLQEQVLFAGYQADIAKFYQAADIFVIPSLREGLPVSTMEAMAADLPCVASRIRGNADLLSQSQLLFEPGNVDDLVRALNMAMDKDIAEAEVSRNQHTLRRFEMSEAIDAMKNVYMKVMCDGV